LESIKVTMVDYRAKDVDHIELKVGEVRTLESLRQAVVPPYVMIIPFLELPPGVELLRQDNLEEDGINGSIYTLRATNAGEGTLRVGFRDLRTKQVVIEKSIRITVR
jgi:hypothetical protein